MAPETKRMLLALGFVAIIASLLFLFWKTGQGINARLADVWATR